MQELISGLSLLRPGRSRRSSSFDRSGGNADYVSVAPGSSFALANIKGAGVVRHIWITVFCPGDLLHRRNLILRMWWDGQEHPSVESPLGDFFGQGWGMEYPFQSLLLSAGPDRGRGLACRFPMPFADGARIEIENQSDSQLERLYFYVDYDELDELPPGHGRFHAHYRQELTAPEGDAENEWETLGPYGPHASDSGNYLWMEAQGRGHYLGVNYYIHSPTPMWPGEGDDMFLVDGEEWPGIHGTGTEDYFDTSWSPTTEFHHPLYGIAKAPTDQRLGWLGRHHYYRFHLTDPIVFQRSLKASIEHGHANCLTLELASVAYWMQELPSLPFPPLPSREERVPRPEITVPDIHRWRDAWLRQPPE